MTTVAQLQQTNTPQFWRRCCGSCVRAVYWNQGSVCCRTFLALYSVQALRSTCTCTVYIFSCSLWPQFGTAFHHLLLILVPLQDAEALWTMLISVFSPLFNCTCFYRAACNADAVLWWEFCPSVRLSVCPSVCHTRVLWQNGRKICPDLYTIRKNI